MSKEKDVAPKVPPLGNRTAQRRKLGRFYHHFVVQLHFPPEAAREPLLSTATNINSTGLYLTDVLYPFKVEEQLSVEMVHPSEHLPKIPGTISRIDDDGVFLRFDTHIAWLNSFIADKV